MNHAKIMQKLDDAGVHMTWMFWLAAVDYVAVPDQLRDFLEDSSPEDFSAVFGLRACGYGEDVDDPGVDAGTLIQDMQTAGILGFVVEAHVPTKVFFGPKLEACEVRYGISRVAHLYADTLQELVRKLVAKAKEFEKLDREKCRKKAA